MAEIVNLKAARKARDRAERERIAAGNRAKHGRTKAEKSRDATDRAKREAVLDQAKRDGDGS